MTAAADIVAKEFGPTVGGLLLAFPAIFPAGATLVDKHEKKRRKCVLDFSRVSRRVRTGCRWCNGWGR
jgi:hypothetical protein